MENRIGSFRKEFTFSVAYTNAYTYKTKIQYEMARQEQMRVGCCVALVIAAILVTRTNKKSFSLTRYVCVHHFIFVFLALLVHVVSLVCRRELCARLYLCEAYNFIYIAFILCLLCDARATERSQNQRTDREKNRREEKYFIFSKQSL